MRTPARVIKAPAPIPDDLPAVFLAGSIDMGRAPPWQTRVAAALAGRFSATELAILDPRRDDWDATWRQSIHEPAFAEQVSWELTGLERAEVVGFYFAETARSPITLFELGYMAGRRQRALIYAPHGWYRRGNLEVAAERFGIPLLADEQAWVTALTAACEDAVSVCALPLTLASETVR